jgi:hypothetical protein
MGFTTTTTFSPSTCTDSSDQRILEDEVPALLPCEADRHQKDKTVVAKLEFIFCKTVYIYIYIYYTTLQSPTVAPWDHLTQRTMATSSEIKHGNS